MEDHVGKKPGRFKIIPEDGKAPYYAVLELADDTIVEGTNINTATLLAQSTAEIFGLDPKTATPNDVFRVLSSLVTRYRVGVQVNLLGVAAPAGIIVRGITSARGDPVATDSNGYVEGYTYQSKATLTIEKLYEDVPTQSIIVDTKNQPFTNATFNVISKPGKLVISKTGSYSFSEAITSIDAFLVGAGGGGACAMLIAPSDRYTTSSGNYASAVAGAGGYTRTEKNLAIPAKSEITCIVGIGGLGGDMSDRKLNSKVVNGRNGGNTGLVVGAVSIIAEGGHGGIAELNSPVNGVNGGSGSGGANGYANTPYDGGSNGSDGFTSNVPGAAPGMGQGTTTTAFEENTGTLYSPAGSSSTYNGSSDMRKVSKAGETKDAPGAGGNAYAELKWNKEYTNKATDGKNGLIIIRWGGAK